MLDICLLGTGGVMPLSHRHLTALLVRYKGRNLLIDCGEGTQIPIAKTKWGFKAIDTILFTHFHADHMAGLPGLMLTMGNSGRVDPLLLVGPVGLMEVIRGLTVIAPELPYDLEIIELPHNTKAEIKCSGMAVKSLPVEHTLPCLAYSIHIPRLGKFDEEKAKALHIPLDLWHKLPKGENVMVNGQEITPEMVLGEARQGIKVCYATDTRPTANLTEFIGQSDIFICEGMYGDDEHLEKAINNQHMLFSEAAMLAKQGQVEELWLTHFSPALTEPENYEVQVKEIFQNAIVGKDLMMKSLFFRK